MKKTILILCALVLAFTAYSCGDKHQTPPWVEPVDPDDPGKDPDPTAEKEKMLWLDAEANFKENFATQEDIRTLLDKVKDVGFNSIVVDVRPVEGDVLYKSDFMASYLDVESRGYDYLQFFIDEARKRELKVTVSMTIFTAGSITPQQGPAWRDPKMKDWACIEYKPDGRMIDIKADVGKTEGGAFVFLNPVRTEVQDYVLSFVKEVVTKYDFDAFALDYCRFPDQESDFSDYTKNAFNDFLGKNGGGKVVNWPADVFTWNSDGKTHNPGTYYKQWWQFRSGVIRDFVERVRTEVKAIKPDVKLHYWAASWWNALWPTGQNWASTSFDPMTDPDAGRFGYGYRFTPDYRKTGFANQLDVFQLGSYLTDVYIDDKGPDGYVDIDPEAAYGTSIEYAVKRAKRIIGNACTLYGTIGTGGGYTPKVVEESAYYCLKNTAGLMVFDIVHVINTNVWDNLKRGMARAEAEIAAEAANE